MKKTKILLAIAGSAVTATAAIPVISCSCNKGSNKIKAIIEVDSNLSYADPNIELGKSFVVDFLPNTGWEVDPNHVEVVIGNKILMLDTDFRVFDNQLIVNHDKVNSSNIKIKAYSRIATIKYSVNHIQGKHITVDLKGASKATKGQNYVFNVKTKNEWYGIDYDNLIFTINGNPAQETWFIKDYATGDVTIKSEYVTGDIVMYIPEIVYVKELIPTHTSIRVPSTGTVEKQLICVAKDDEGNTISNPNLNWSTSAERAGLKLFSTGYVQVNTGTIAGGVTINVKSNDAKAQSTTFTLTLKDPSVDCTFSADTSAATHITVTPTANPKTGEAYEFTVIPQEGYEINKATWTLKTGDTTLVYNTDWVYDETTHTVKIYEDKITGNITFTVAEIVLPWTVEITGDDNILSGDEKTYTATVKDKQGNTITDPALEWKCSDTTKATIDSTGKLKAVEGLEEESIKVVITATSGSASITKEVEIQKSWKVTVTSNFAEIASSGYVFVKNPIYIKHDAKEFTVSFHRDGYYTISDSGRKVKIKSEYSGKTETTTWSFDINQNDVSFTVNLTEVSTTNINVTINEMDKYTAEIDQAEGITDGTYSIVNTGMVYYSLNTLTEGTDKIYLGIIDGSGPMASLKTLTQNIKYTVSEYDKDDNFVKTITSGTFNADSGGGMHFYTCCTVSISGGLSLEQTTNKVKVHVELYTE